MGEAARDLAVARARRWAGRRAIRSQPWNRRPEARSCRRRFWSTSHARQPRSGSAPMLPRRRRSRSDWPRSSLRSSARLRAVPAWAWLVAIVAGSTVFRALVARGMPGPFIFIDELIYSELAKSFASGGHFLVRDVPTSGYGIVYPVLISPAYRLFDDLPHGVRGREDDQQPRHVARRRSRLPARAPACCGRSSRCWRRCSPSRCPRWSTRAP